MPLCVFYYNLFSLRNRTKLNQNISRYFCINAEHLLKSNRFLGCKHETVQNITKCSVVKFQITILEFFKVWLKSEKKLTTRDVNT
jgi:hypothetical protein